jgi:hypothetical protein
MAVGLIFVGTDVTPAQYAKDWPGGNVAHPASRSKARSATTPPPG